MPNTFFLSHPLSPETPLFTGRKAIEIRPEKEICRGDSCNTAFLTFPNHASTHVDAPYHFVPNGKTLTDLGPDFWVFRNVALAECDASAGQLIEFADLKFLGAGLSPRTEIFLVRSGFEAARATERYWKESPGLAPALAAELRERAPRLRAVGMDFLSATSPLHREAGRVAHREFLGREIVLIEDMKLSPLAGVPREIVALPLLVRDIDGAPITVLAFA